LAAVREFVTTLFQATTMLICLACVWTAISSTQQSLGAGKGPEQAMVAFGLAAAVAFLLLGATLLRRLGILRRPVSPVDSGTRPSDSPN
jgi:hypothetical protein